MKCKGIFNVPTKRTLRSEVLYQQLFEIHNWTTNCYCRICRKVIDAYNKGKL